MSFDELVKNRPYGGYQMIMADPAWTFELFNEETGKDKSAQAQYECMSIEDIKSLPVGSLAGRDCILWLWATNPMLLEAIDTLHAWGFTYVTAGAWAKKTVNNKYRWGTGYVLRSTHEPFLIGRIGKPTLSRSIPSCFDGLAREHSRKPEEAYALAEKMIVQQEASGFLGMENSEVKRLDLFSRQKRPGWKNYGFEADKFKT